MIWNEQLQAFTVEIVVGGNAIRVPVAPSSPPGEAWGGVSLTVLTYDLDLAKVLYRAYMDRASVTIAGKAVNVTACVIHQDYDPVHLSDTVNSTVRVRPYVRAWIGFAPAAREPQ